ncbi:DUF1905 domain-containing protein [Flavobacteriaceae bacterium M23B6Z8]
MQAKIKYDFSGKIWKHNANGGWFFVSLPKDISKEIREHLKWQEEGWGRMKASAHLDGIQWETAIWFDKRLDTYLLPIKADIRKKAVLNLDDKVSVSISI